MFCNDYAENTRIIKSSQAKSAFSYVCNRDADQPAIQHYLVKASIARLSLQKYEAFTVALSRQSSNTTIAEFANTVDPDETAHLDLQRLSSSL